MKNGLSIEADVFGGRLPAEMPASPPWPSAWAGLTPFAFWIVWALRPRRLVELGVFQGLSYCAFCEEVARLALDTRCTGIDTWEGDAHAGHYGAEVLRTLRAHHDPLYGRFSTLMPMPFDAANSSFETGSIDLLHIDGLHTYEAVRHDFETWQGKLSPDAVVLFHDISVERPGFGVRRFWDEVRQGRPHFALHHSHGLGILGVGRQYPPPLAALFDAADAGATRIRAVFETLGEHVATRHRLQRDLRDAILPTGRSLQAVNLLRRWRQGLSSAAR